MPDHTEPIPPVTGVVVPDGSGGTRVLRPADVARVLGDLVGRRLPGGCDDCRGEHEYVQDVPDVFDVLVFHDDTCPQVRAAGG
jgi:hypothetical protein